MKREGEEREEGVRGKDTYSTAPQLVMLPPAGGDWSLEPESLHTVTC